MLAVMLGWGTVGTAQEQATILEKVILGIRSVPITLDFDHGIGSDGKGSRQTLKVQAIVPFPINDRYSVVSRTIIPYVHQENVVTGSGEESGLGDITQILYFTPNKRFATKNGTAIGWSLGGALLLATGGDTYLSAGQWAAGPSAAFSLGGKKWNAGFIGHHIWSFAGDADRPRLNRTVLQPAISYRINETYTASLTSDGYYDWDIKDWSVPLMLSLHRRGRIAGKLVNVSGGIRYWVDDSALSPKGVGLRFNITFLVPK